MAEQEPTQRDEPEPPSAYLTREQGVSVQALGLAIQTMQHGWALFKANRDKPDEVPNFVLDIARRYRDFINEQTP